MPTHLHYTVGMSTQAVQAQYTIRGVPEHVNDALRAEARHRGVSFNQLLVDELTKAAGGSTGRIYRSLDNLAGQWQEDPDFDQTMEEQRQVDWSLWK